MALIELHPQLSETNKLLARIAESLERFLFETYKVRLGSCTQPAADPHPELEPTVEYHTDSDTLREELKTLAGYTPPEDANEDESSV